MGWFEFRICNIDGNPNDATQECLDKTLLKDISGATRFKVAADIKDFKYRIALPEDLTCNQCVFQVMFQFNLKNISSCCCCLVEIPYWQFMGS